VDAALSRDVRSEIRIKMHVVEMGANGEPLYVNKSDVLPAKTHFEVVERLERYTILLCKPHTGRQHQIRVHLDHVGHPIAGDKLYGVEAAFFLRSMREILNVEVEPGIELTRHALHAHKLTLDHPRTGKRMEFSSPWPPELENFLAKVRNSPKNAMIWR
jgi:23S rRNA-/tRNA-specific pseudouridylate synthase